MAWVFLSTPSARRATYPIEDILLLVFISIHALREEGDHRNRAGRRGVGISIHALREEGDAAGLHRDAVVAISIHALREEGDRTMAWTRASLGNFYPRPPRGGRQTKNLKTMLAQAISIHALREEGDSPER